jgi:hypothetical protein
MFKSNSTDIKKTLRLLPEELESFHMDLT